tara:strand:- start:487 stop:3510 length:3024 start_codon:yes stop_codon:yes gene_type:complete
MPIAEEYLGYTAKWKGELGEKTIVLIQVGSFFEVYALRDDNGNITGSDIVQFASINDMVIAPKNRMFVDGKTVLMAGFGLAQIDKYVNKMQERGYTIVIYKQDLQAKNTTRSLDQIISPGTFFSPDTDNISNTTMCVWMEEVKAGRFSRSASIMIGISTLDIFTGKSTMFQTELPYHHNPTTYDDLERCVAIHRPMECLIVSNMKGNIVNDIISFTSLDNSKLHIIDPKTDGLIAKHASNAAKQTYQKELFTRMYPDISEETIVSSIMQTHSLAAQSFVLLIDFVCEHNPHLISRLSEPSFETGANELVLANHSLTQLNILEDQRHTGKLRSVGTFLNNCVTVMGKRKFSYDLHHPTTNKVALNESYDVTSCVLRTNEWVDYRNELTGIHDLEKLSRKIALKRVTPKDMSLLFDDLQKVLNLCAFTNANAESSGLVNKYTMPHGEPVDHCNVMMKTLEATFHLDKCLCVNDMSQERIANMNTDNMTFIKQGVSEEIDGLVNDCLNSRLQLEAIVATLSGMVAIVEGKGKSSKTSTSTKYVKLHETAKSEPMVVATKRRIVLLKSHISKLKEKTIQIEYLAHDGTMVSFEFNLAELDYGSMGTNKKEEVICNDIIKSITSKVQKSVDELALGIIVFWKEYVSGLTESLDAMKVITSYITMMDLLQCKAYIAHKYNYCKPEIVAGQEKAFCSFTGIRHPLIEHIQTSEVYVTNDLALGGEGYEDGLLLYGTNAVGKTSFIKSVGISVIMAQAGLFVPCASFRYSPYTYIFTRILGNDNLFKGLSTFAVEMSELRTIITLSDENSLILGDELCSGTESDSALSIFTAGIEALHEKRCTFMFATHFHEVTHYDEVTSLERLRFAHMEVTYDRENEALVYDRKLKEGSGNTMYGLEVCKSLNLPEDFLTRAHNIRTKYNKSAQGLLSQSASRYNKGKLGGNCEICIVNRATEVHHLQHQARADTENGYISTFHKNHLANLINICEKCHTNIHRDNKEHRVKKTSNGYKIVPI